MTNLWHALYGCYTDSVLLLQLLLTLVLLAVCSFAPGFLFVRRLRWSPSKVVREGIRLLAASHPGSGHPKIVGLGKFSSGRADLGSNKKHLQGFGQ